MSLRGAFPEAILSLTGGLLRRDASRTLLAMT